MSVSILVLHVCETTTKTEAKIIIPNGTWYWRVQAVYSTGGSVFSAPVKTYVTPEPFAGGLLLGLALLLLRSKKVA